MIKYHNLCVCTLTHHIDCLHFWWKVFLPPICNAWNSLLIVTFIKGDRGQCMNIVKYIVVCQKVAYQMLRVICFVYHDPDSQVWDFFYLHSTVVSTSACTMFLSLFKQRWTVGGSVMITKMCSFMKLTCIIIYSILYHLINEYWRYCYC